MDEANSGKPIWDRGDPIDAQMLAFTTGDDPLWDRRLVEHDLVRMTRNLGSGCIANDDIVQPLQLHAGIAHVRIGGTVLELVTSKRQLHPRKRDQRKP